MRNKYKNLNFSEESCERQIQKSQILYEFQSFAIT